MKYLEKYTNLKINNVGDRDTLKHISYNRKKVLESVNCDKIIYLYNDPLLAIKSHFRRNWAFSQLEKHGNPYQLKEKDVESIDKYLEMVQQSGMDMFGIKEQYEFYLNDDINKDILFVNFNNIIKNKSHIAKFIGVDESIFSNIEIKTRKCQNGNDESVKNIYEKLYDRINKMDCQIRKCG